MALILCPECFKKISDSAKECVHCGYPLKTRDTASYSTRIDPKQFKSKEYPNVHLSPPFKRNQPYPERTSKHYKIHVLLSFMLIIGSIIYAFKDWRTALVMLAIGILYRAVAKFLVWWNRH